MTKIVYLDQNKWIDLARAFYDREDGQKFKDTLSFLQDKVEKNEIIIPISVVHLIETAKNANKDKRERLANFIASLSKGYGIVSYLNVRDLEIENAILKRIGKPLKHDISKSTIGKGLSYTVGLDIEGLFQSDGLDKLREQINLNPVFAARFMIDLIDRDEVKKIVEDIEDISGFEKEREEKLGLYSKEMRLRIGISEMAVSLILPLVIKQLNRMNIEPKEFADDFKNIDDWKNFFFSMPTLDIWINLHTLRDNDKSKPIHRNDLKDIGFLSIAIPYCDLVVTENYWANMLKTNKFDKKYNCEIITDINQLKEIIK